MIQILTTGGTIEGLEYDHFAEAPKNPPISIIQHFLTLKNIPDYKIKKLFSKDSKHISLNDRGLIVQEIKKSDAESVLITHGTITMVKTAKYIGIQNISKKIILTGAFILGTSADTDAIDNLDFAIREFENLPNGTYIAMHNMIFTYDNVKKDLRKNCFVKLS